jgi:phospholipid/cholesterol/gamma-HCH transport system substrate-binding protein
MTLMTLLQRRRNLVVVVAAAVVLSGCDFTPYSLPLPGGADLGSHPYTVKAEFRDALDLVPQAGVRSQDVAVGRIKNVTLNRNSWTAEVTMEINGDTVLPDNARATIRQTSLLGEKFVSLDAPTGGGYGRLSNGDVIGLEQSGRNPELEEVLSAAALLFNGGGLDKVNTITRELNNLMDGRESNIRDLIQNATSFTQTLDANKDAILTALEKIDKLALATNKQEDEIDGALRDIPPALKVLDKQRNDLVDMLESLDDLSDVATDVIRRSKADTLTDLRNLQPVVSALADAGDSLVGALRGLLTFPFSDGLVDDSLARVESSCSANTVEFARKGYCPGDYLNLDINISLNAQQAAGLIAALLSMGGVTLPAAPLSTTSTAKTAKKSATSITPTGDDDSADTATPTSTETPSDSDGEAAEPEQKKGLLCGLLSLCRVPALSVAEARQTDLGRLLVEPVVSE